jgi:hypothetical protein
MNRLLFPGKKVYISLHLLAWGIVFILPIYFWSTDIQRDTPFYLRLYINVISFVILFYVNYIWLIPKLFFRNKRLLYFGVVAAVAAALFLISNVLNDFFYARVPHNKELEDVFRKLMMENKIPRPAPNMHIYNYIINSVLVTGFSMGLCFANRFAQNEKERKEMEKEKLNSELAFLKNQISPHFFFNTLNNIYSLIQIDAGDAQKSVLKLSKLMRYLLYETENAYIQLDKEIDFMNNYIDLMRLRLSNKVDVKVAFPENTSKISVPPLLFISFIENAFKHGISYRDHSFIFINMEATPKQIAFTCVNSLVKKDIDEKDSGIGLENINKRLALLFPDKYKLTIDKTGAAFEVSLTISLV